jgi:import inner membrane translocase subunit TIM16
MTTLHLQRFRHLYEVNDKHGSFYLTSKVYRARERLEGEYVAEGKKTDEPDDPFGGTTSEKKPEGPPPRIEKPQA